MTQKFGVLWVVSMVAVLSLTLSPAWTQRSATAKETKADALKEMLDKDEKALIIDVRTDEEVKTGSIPGAIHIPVAELQKRMADIPKDVRLVFT